MSASYTVLSVSVLKNINSTRTCRIFPNIFRKLRNTCCYEENDNSVVS